MWYFCILAIVKTANFSSEEFHPKILTPQFSPCFPWGTSRNIHPCQNSNKSSIIQIKTHLEIMNTAVTIYQLSSRSFCIKLLEILNDTLVHKLNEICYICRQVCYKAVTTNKFWSWWMCPAIIHQQYRLAVIRNSCFWCFPWLLAKNQSWNF